MPSPEGMQGNLSSRHPAFFAVQHVFGHVLYKRQDWAIRNLQRFIHDHVAYRQNNFSQLASAPAPPPPQISDTAGSICYQNIREMPTSRTCVSVLQ